MKYSGKSVLEEKMNKIIKNKYLKSIFIVTVIALLCILAYNGYKFIVMSTNEDIIIYEHYDSKFLFCITDILDDNRLEIVIDNYAGRGFLWLENPFYYGEEGYRPKDGEKITVLVPEGYDISYNTTAKDDRQEINALRSYIYSYDEEKYGLSEIYADFKVCGYDCPPNLLELKDGRKYIVYKKFNYLYMKELTEV